MPASHSATVLATEPRTEFGKGAARRIRRAHRIPAVLYGHGTAPRHLSLPGHETMLAVKIPNALLSLDLGQGESSLAIVKDLQIDPVKREIEHIDFVIVRRGERVAVNVPVVVTGEAAPETTVAVETSSLAVTAEATSLPETISVDVTGAEAGTHVTAAQLTLPQGTELAGDPDTIVVAVLAQALLSEDDDATDDEAAEAVEAVDDGPADDAGDES